jgi:hypothetical protein
MEENAVAKADGNVAHAASCLPGESRGARQRGAIAVIFAVLLPVIIVFYGLALDLARIYSRKAEMQAIAGTMAIAAAKKLNGTALGITDAVAAAGDVLLEGDDPVFRPKVAYVNTMAWSGAGIAFSRTADGSTGWLDAGAAAAAPNGLAFVRVDTGAFDASYGAVDMLFVQVLSTSLTTIRVAHTAVAGRGRLNVTPLGICAMSTAPNHITSRSNAAGFDELLEYGFRRGVGYNLMALNPQSGSTTGATFLVDPIALNGSGTSPKNLTLATVSPYVCTGTMAVPRLVGETVNVQSGFPLSSLVSQLNSRFDQYTGNKCDASTAPPDKNVKQYTAGSSLGWMSPALPATSQSAEKDTSVRLQTKADLAWPNSLTTAQSGPLWAYAKPVPWSSYTAGQPEPAGGYTPFPTTQASWDGLYGSAVKLGAYPTASTPYASMTSVPSLTHRPGVASRRMLNVPILDCATMPSSTATVLAIGKFFMTVPAVSSGTTNTISAEFAGATSQVQAGGPVELVQ